MQLRGQDAWGSGAFKASRGDRDHNGVDIIAQAGSPFFAMTQGVVTKLGYPYADDLSYRYVEVTDRAGGRWRYFYLEPGVEEDDVIEPYDKLGIVQDIQARYDKRMTPHLHFEIINAHGEYVDPTGIVKGR